MEKGEKRPRQYGVHAFEFVNTSRICEFLGVYSHLYMCRNGLYVWQMFNFVLERFVDMIVMCEFLTFLFETLPSFFCSWVLIPHFV